MKDTFLLAIEYCDKTKNDADWNSWIHRILLRNISDFFSSVESDINTQFDFIDLMQTDLNEVDKFSGEVNLKKDFKEKELISILEKIPFVLRAPIILKEIHSLSYNSIADLVDVPNGVIATRIYRARKLIFLFTRKNFNYEDQKKSSADRHPNKIIFELRKCALSVDEELSEKEKNEFNLLVNDSAKFQIELLLQQKVKNLFKNLTSENTIPGNLQTFIEKRARKRFGSS